jgi:hypothetical protein
VRPPIAVGPVWGSDAAKHARLGKYCSHALVPGPVHATMVIVNPEPIKPSVRLPLKRKGERRVRMVSYVCECVCVCVCVCVCMCVCMCV